MEDGEITFLFTFFLIFTINNYYLCILKTSMIYMFTILSLLEAHNQETPEVHGQAHGAPLALLVFANHWPQPVFPSPPYR